MNIGEKIKYCRELEGISQRELGRRIEKTGQFISLIESGNSKPSFDTLQDISLALSTSMSYFVDNENNNNDDDDDNLTKDELLIKSKVAALEGLDNIVKYAIESDMLKDYCLTRTEEDSLLDMLIYNIVNMSKIINNIPFDIRLDCYKQNYDSDNKE